MHGCVIRQNLAAAQFDGDMAAKAQEAESAGQKLVYVGHVDVASGKCTVGLKVSLSTRSITISLQVLGLLHCSRCCIYVSVAGANPASLCQLDTVIFLSEPAVPYSMALSY